MQEATSQSIYRRAAARLSPEELERERSRGIPYKLSLSALSRVFFEAGRAQGWINRKQPVVLAVSGGGDSMALLWLFRAFYEGKLLAAHMEHGIRGEDSLADARFVEETARRWGAEPIVRHVSVPKLLLRGESIEAGARRMRYAFLEAVAEEYGAWGVALGHNKEDAAETVLFNLLRGAGVRGAAGIPERRGIFFRPLLSCSRDFLRAILRCRGIQWREDNSNDDSGYTRNFIRNELMPLIENKINKKAADHLVAFSSEMRYYREAEESAGDVMLKNTSVNGGGMWCIDREKAWALSLKERAVLVRAVGRGLCIPSISRERCERLALLINGRARFEFQWGEGVSVFGERDRVLWYRRG